MPKQEQLFRLKVSLALVTALYFFANLQKVIIPGPLFDKLQFDFGAEASTVTGMGAIFMYTYAFGQLLIGPLADRWGAGKIMLYGILAMTIGSLATPLAPNIWTLYICRLLAGGGAGTVATGIVLDTAKVYPDSYQVVLGINLMLGFFGSICGGAPFVYGVKLMGWRPLTVVIGLLTALLYVIWLICFRGIRQEHVPISPSDSHWLGLNKYLRVFRQYGNLYIFCSQSISYGVFFVVQTIIGHKFLQDFCNISPAQAGYVTSAMMLTACFSGLTYASIHKWLGGKLSTYAKILIGCRLLSVTAILLAVYFRYANPFLLGTAMICLAAAANMTPTVTALMQKLNPPEIFASTFSFNNFISFFSTGIQGTLIGAIMGLYTPVLDGERLVYGRDTYLMVFLLLTGIALFAFLSILRLHEPNNSAQANAK